MGRYGIGFNDRGRFTTFPGVFPQIVADQLDLRGEGPTGVMAILGPGAGLFPPKVATSLPVSVNAPSAYLTPSDLLTAATFAHRPFPQLDRAVGQLFLVPVTPATKATMTLRSSTPTDLATLSSKGWGTKFNAITVKHEAGPLLTITLPTDTSSIVEKYTYTTIQDLVDQLNGRSAIVSAAFIVEGAIANFTSTAMTGGTEPAATNQDWADALTALNGFRVNVIHVASSSSAIWAMLSDYCIARRCRGFIGGALQNWNGISARQTAIAALKAEAAALNAPRMMHVGLGGDGQPSYLSAARHAALAAALEPSVPMTFKQLGFSAIEARLDYDTELGGVDGLLLAGVAPPCPDPDSLGTFVVSRGLSTWSGDDNLYRREHSVLAAIDGLVDLLTAALSPLKGGEGTVGAATRAVGLVDETCNRATKATSTIRINGYRRESIVATIEDTVLRVTVAVTPIPPLNFLVPRLNLERTQIEVAVDVDLAA